MVKMLENGGEVEMKFGQFWCLVRFNLKKTANIKEGVGWIFVKSMQRKSIQCCIPSVSFSLRVIKKKCLEQIGQQKTWVIKEIDLNISFVDFQW